MNHRHIGRFDSVAHARTQPELLDAIDNNIETLNSIIRDCVRTVQKYTKQRSELEQLRREIEVRNA